MKTWSEFKLYLILFVIVALCAAPMGLAWLAYSNHQDFKTTNHGHLIQPVVFYNSLKLHDGKGNPIHHPKQKWTLMYLSTQSCGVSCQHNLKQLFQIHKALGKDYTRIERLLVEFDGQNTTIEQPALNFAQLSPEKFDKLMKRLKVKHPEDRIFIVDPLGNVIMHYHAGVKGNYILHDLEKLLRVSRIG